MTDPYWDTYVKTSAALDELLAKVAEQTQVISALRAENAALLLEVAPLRAARARFADIDECLCIPVGEYPEIPQSAAPAIPPAGVRPAVRREAGQPTSDGHSNPQ